MQSKEYYIMAVSKALSFESTVTINELRVAIPLLGETITPVIISEPGVGKSSLLAMLAEDNETNGARRGISSTQINTNTFSLIARCAM